MKKDKVFVMGIQAIIMLFISACATSDIYSDRDETVPISHYQTFAWFPTPADSFQDSPFNNQIVEHNVKSRSTEILMAKGYKPDVDTPDVIFEYQIHIQHKIRQEQQPVYNYAYNYRNYQPYYNPYWRNNNFNAYNNAPYVVGYKTVDVPYEEGTITISAIDRKLNRLVWRGWAVVTVVDPEQYEQEIKHDLLKIFERFPNQELYVAEKK